MAYECPCLKKNKSVNVTVNVPAPPPAPSPCGPGYTYDPKTEQCVPNGPPKK